MPTSHSVALLVILKILQMLRFMFIILFLLSTNIYGQKSEIESLINQIALNEIPDNFEYYFLVTKSLEERKIRDSLANYEIRELKMIDKDFPLDLIYGHNLEKTDWKKYELKNVRYVPEEYGNQSSPPRTKNVQFAKYNIDQKEYDSLLQNRKPHTIIVKKKWFWRKKRVWKNKQFHQQVVKAWKMNEENNKEEKLYLEFSKPLFSKNQKYARVSVFKSKRCNGNGFTTLYKNVNGVWKYLIEYNQVYSETIGTHSRCGDMSISY